MSPPNLTRAEPFEIALIAGYPEAVPVIEAGYKAEWDFWCGSGGMAKALFKTDYRQYSPSSLAVAPT